MGTWGKFTQRKAATVLGVSTQTVKNMLLDGRLSSPLNQAEVERLRKSWALVPYSLAADEASRWDPCWRRCLACLSFFHIKRSWVTKGRGNTCSIECRDRWRSVVNPSAAMIKVIKVRVRKSTNRPRRFFAGTCNDCGTPFVTTYSRSTTCSAQCLARTLRKQRKARERGAVKTERIYKRRVYERDNWRCHICGKKVDRTVAAEHPRAPTLDHIHPLKVPGDLTSELGGPHLYSNVKTAHFGCNSARGNRDQFQMTMPIAA